MRKWRITRKSAAAAALAALMAVCALPCAVYAEAQAKEEETEESTDEELYRVLLEELETEEAGTEEEPGGATYTKQEVPFYFGTMESTLTYPLYFINDAMDLPYINLEDWADLMVQIYGDVNGPYKLRLEIDGNVTQLTRENGYSMIIDFEEEKILFDDYDAFIHETTDYSLLDVVSDSYTDENGNPVLIDRVQKGSFDRYGREVELDLAAYQIPLYTVYDEGLYLVPLQTMSDFLISNSTNRSLLFNTKAVYFGGKTDFGFGTPDLTPIGESYLYSAPSNMLSEDLAWYSYCELCLALDNLYGQKENHDIRSFDSIFTDTGYKHDLLSTDPNVKDGALLDFINYYLDDMHSGFVFSSYLTDHAEAIGGEGLSSIRDSQIEEIFNNARMNADHQIKPYEEVGNTAYVTFDHFYMPDVGTAYYGERPELGDDPSDERMDTADLIIYAHKQITRENSPIENVVIDLSLNGGGDSDAAAFVAAWFLGEASMSIKSTMTGAISTGTYRVDTNLDGVFDEKDSVRNKNLFCLIGPYSFSCGNLVPNIFKASKIVTLLGKQSGGGSCSVLSMSTAYGTLFNISSPRRMSYQKNGSYYDTDTGIDPDCIIVRPASFYNRQALTDYINKLF